MRAAVLGAQIISGSGLTTMRREGMAGWIKAIHEKSKSLPVTPAARPPAATSAPAKNELTAALASLIVTISAEPNHA